MKEGLAETVVNAEVTEVRWEAVEDDTWASEVVKALELEATGDGADGALEEAVALEMTCVCLWSAIYLWT